MKINTSMIGDNHPTFIIAEMSANHGQDINKALDLVYAAKEAGADAIKLQTYTPDTLTLEHKSKDFYINNGPWSGQYMYDLYKDAYMPWDWHGQLFELANKIDISIFSSPFDASAIQFLEELGCPAYKIASPEVIDLPLIRRASKTKKPIIISTGSATITQINEVLKCLEQEKTKDFALLKCTSEYPASPEDINLKTLPHMREKFNCIVGLSDHTIGIGVAVASVAFGAQIIEKHFVMDRDDKTADSFFSSTPEEFKLLVENVRIVEKAIGKVNYPQVASEPKRCLIVVNDIKKGELLTNKNIKSLRPGGGIEPKHLDEIIYHYSAKRKISKGTLLQWNMLKPN